ncbi:conserved hypothetical protein [Listeria ivanovii FSL F6-596]|nr:conserved hypothetical protein [Listeria ivanovii FSL F6-596]
MEIFYVHLFPVLIAFCSQFILYYCEKLYILYCLCKKTEKINTC